MATPFDTSFNNGDVIEPDHVKQFAAPINALETEIESKGQPNGLASLDATGKVPASQLPAFGGGGADSLDDLTDVAISLPSSGQVLRHNGTEFVNASLGASDMPSGIDAAKIGSGSVSNAELAYLDGVTSSIQTQLNSKAASSHTHVISDVTNLQTNLNAKQDTSAKNAANGYAGLDANSKLSSSQMSEVMPLNGLSDVSITTPSTGQMVRFNGTTWVNSAPAAADMPSGIDAAKIGSGAVSNAEFGYLDGVTSSVQTQLDGKAAASHAHPISDVTNLQTNLDAKEDKSAKGAVNGYASLDASGKVPASQLPPGSGGGASSLDDLSDVALSSPASGQVLRYTGTQFVNASLSSGDIGAAPASHNHSATNITSGTLPIARGGTNATTASDARANLAVPGGSGTDGYIASWTSAGKSLTSATGQVTCGNIIATSIPARTASGAVLYAYTSSTAPSGQPIGRHHHLASTKKYKKNIRPMEMVKDRLYKLNPVRYDGILPIEVDENGDLLPEGSEPQFTHQEAFGLIAEEVQEVFPDLVFSFPTDDDPDVLGVHYDRLPTYLLSAMKEQQDEIEALKQRLSTLERAK